MQDETEALAAKDGLALPKTYDPRAVEGRVYRRWLEADAFDAPDRATGARFALVMPPPNVTSVLHMGHALDNALQDVYVRWHRMRGEATLWVPGTDHAGIATHAVIERRLQAQGETRQGLGRERFVQRVWEWKQEYEERITGQLHRLGCSCDWRRQRFTMDPGLSAAVEEAFVRYYEEGLLYKGQYIVNWCPGCGSAISDLEVEHEEEESRLYRVRYPLVGGGEVVVATVRPETMLGDTALAVHPQDARYAALVGRRAVLPLVGREIPVVADPHVDPAFGTGVLKVTPAHDAADAEIARRHGLPALAVIGTDGRLTAEAGRFAGLTVPEARQAVVEALAAAGQLAGMDPYRAPVGHCSRCGSVIEPLISRQWFLRVGPLCQAAAAAVRAGEVRLHPEGFTHVFLQWMEGAHDWCVSRQIWWGHRIPAYECARCGALVVARTRDAPTVCPRCGAPAMERDPDVLDTWFSSALWPFSVLGWPQPTAELETYFPTDLLVTGKDIIFLWVARMVFSSLHFMGRVPFRDVLLHGLVRDAQGRKMSKSLGNGVDPLDLVERYGADALRHALLVGVAPGHDMRFSPDKLEGSQRFCNKLWNAARFALGALGTEGAATVGTPLDRTQAPEDGWITARLQEVTAQVEEALGRFDPGAALQALTAFVWEEFCDWYLEAVKGRLAGRCGSASAQAARQTLGHVLEALLRLLHPFLPFVTEALWEHLPGEGLLVRAAWPRGGEGPADQGAVQDFGLVQAVVGAIRSLRADWHLPPTARPLVLLPTLRLSPGQRRLVVDLARVASCEERAPAPGEQVVSAVVGQGGALVLLPVAGVVDLAQESQRLRRDREAAAAERERVRARLADQAFCTRARPEVVARERRRLEELEAALRGIEARLGQLAPGGPGGAEGKGRVE
jgi:valyl-tRNA synthetase